MAESTKVGSTAISLEIEVTSSLEKQISKVTSSVADKLKSSIESKTNKSDLSSTITKSLSSFSTKFKQAGSKVGKKISDGIKESVKKSEKDIARSIEKATTASTSSVGSGVKVKKGLTREDIVERKDHQINERANLEKQLEVVRKSLEKQGLQMISDLQNQIKKAELEFQHARLSDSAKEELLAQIKGLKKELESARVGEAVGLEMLKTEQQALRLSGNIAKLGIDIRNLGSMIDEIDLNQMNAQTEESVQKQSRLSRAFERVKTSISGVVTAGKSMISSGISKGFNSVKKSINGMYNSGKNFGKNQFNKAFNAITKGSKRANTSLLNTKQIARSLVRNFLGINMALRAVSTGVRRLAQSFWASLKTNDQFSNSLQQIKSNLSTAFHPIISSGSSSD